MYTFKQYTEGKHATWAVYQPNGALLCVCQYKKGARAVCEHINALCGHVPLVAYVDHRVNEMIAEKFPARFDEVRREFDKRFDALCAKGVL